MNVKYQWEVLGIEDSLKRRIESTVENEIKKLEKTPSNLRATFIKNPNKNKSCICDLTNESGQFLKQYLIDISGNHNDEIVAIFSEP